MKESARLKFVTTILLAAALLMQARDARAASQAPGEVLAGLADLNFEVMGSKQGLPHDSVYGLTQDSRGFLWIATFGGLSRYDGYQLRNYTHNEHEPTSLPDNNIRAILPAPNGGLWIATGNAGVITFDAATDTFHPLPNLPAVLQRSHIFCMADDGNGGIWFGSQIGLVHYLPKTYSYEVLGKAAGSANPEGFTEGSVFSVLTDHEGSLWVGGDNGLLVRRAGSAKFESVTGLAGAGQVGEFPAVWTIFEDNEGRLWIGTDKTGIGLLNRATNHIESVAGMSGTDSVIGAATVRGVVEVRKDQFWIATYGNGLITFNADTGRSHRTLRDLTAAAPLSNNFLRGIFMDRTGIVWLGTDHGLSKINSTAEGLLNIHSSPLRVKGLQGNEVRSVTTQDDRIWVGFDQGGFAVIDADGGIQNVRPAPGVPAESLSKREVLSIRADHDVVYAGGSGLYEIDTKRLTYRPIPNPMLAKQVVNAMLLDGNDLWVGTYNGLARYNRTTHSVRMYPHDVNDPGSLSDNYVRDLIRSSNGELWITTRLGLDRFDEASGKFFHIRHDPHDADSLPTDNIQPIAEDLHGRLWIGTIGSGLTVLENRTPDGKTHFRTLNRQNGFPDDLVLTVMRGKDGRIWCNTPVGLAVVDPETFKVHTYTAADGLRTSSQNLFSSATLIDGTIVFPGDEGLIIVRPDLLRNTLAAPALVATEIAIPGSSTSPSALAWNSIENGIVLPPSHRAFHASFASLDYTGADAVRYSYKLEGFDKEWLDSATYNRTAAYTNLPAGRYRLLIRAVGRLGSGPDAELEIPVTVYPPWYERTWFLLLKILAAFAILILAVRLRTAVIERRQAELEREVALRTAELGKNQSELVRANAKLATLATFDSLTGVYNRRRFLEIAEAEVERTKRSGGVFTLLLIDADYFKSINDRFGHTAGDEVLKMLVQTLSEQLRRNDILARYGGEELVILLPDTNLQNGVLLAERLREGIASSSVSFEDQIIQVTISVGATEGNGDEDIETVLRKADSALYVAKNAGRNLVVPATIG